MVYASDKASIVYHDLFDYPLTKEELYLWKSSLSIKSKKRIENKGKFYFISGRQGIIKKRLENEKYSQKKLLIAKKAARVISIIPSVLFVGITGSLAMMSAGKNSDIDLMIITKKNTLWTTRLLVYCVLHATGYTLRRPKFKDEKDALCLNMWLDESDLTWRKRERNIFTAHEMAQIVPLVNKKDTYEKMMFLNKWLLDYWPNFTKIVGYKEKVMSLDSTLLSLFFDFLNLVCFSLQYLYMKSKITRELVTLARAIFHQNDWSKVVIKKLNSVK